MKLPSPLRRMARTVLSLGAAGWLGAIGPALACTDCYLDSLHLTSNATYVANAGSGNWNTPGSWVQNAVPPAGARVHIPSGSTITYNRNDATNAIQWVRVDGTLNFSTSTNTTLRVDTIYVAPGGTLRIGTTAAPVSANVRARIRFTGGPIRTDDTQMMTRGLLSMGTVEICGATKKNFVASTATPGVTATTLSLAASVPADWVDNATTGDELVITGTSWNANNALFSQDEVVRLTGKNASQITFAPGLTYARTLPAGQGAQIYVANLTRNVVLESEETTATQRRAHAMFMTATTDVRHAQFRNMGRTNKNEYVTDPGLDPQIYVDNNDNDNDDVDFENSTANARGRYPVHLHKPGINAGIAKFIGLSVVNSPGWGIAIHDGEAEVRDCVTFDVLGAHYFAEIGNERVWMTDNIAIKARGATAIEPIIDMLQVDESEKGRRQDWGAEGLGYWFHTTYSIQEFSGNVAAGMADVGLFVWGHNDDHAPNNPKLMVPTTKFSSYAPGIAGTRTDLPAIFVPAKSFTGLVTLNAEGAARLGGPLRDDDGFNQQLTEAGNTDPTTRFTGTGHLVPNVFENIKGFRLREYGVKTDYASHIHLKNAQLISVAYPGVVNRPLNTGMSEPIGAGIWQQKNGRHITVENATVRGWHSGVRLGQTAGQSLQDVSERQDLGASRVIGGTFSHNTFHLYPAVGRANEAPGDTHVLNRPPFAHNSRVTGSPSFSDLGGAVPVASFVAVDRGGRGYILDASASSDSDYAPEVVTDFTGAPISTNDIASYAWDIGNDGTVDGYGRRLKWVFPATGSVPVKLTVMDAEGKTASTVSSVNVVASAYQNIVADSTFSSGVTTKGYGSYNFGLQDRWLMNEGNRTWTQTGGYMEANTTVGEPGLAQIIRDDALTRGGTVLKLRFRYWRQASPVALQVRVWGVQADFWTAKYKAPTSLTPLLRTQSAGHTVLLDTQTINSGPLGSWEDATYNLADLGTGYKYIIVSFESQNASTTAALRVDDVTIAP